MVGLTWFVFHSVEIWLKMCVGLIRTYPGLTTLDAAHVATALRLKIPLLETFDDRLIALGGLEGDPPLVIRNPKWDVSMGPLFEHNQ